MSFKDINSYWRLFDTFSVTDAAALIAEFEPSAVDASGDYFKDKQTGLTDSDGIVDVQTVLTGLIRSITAGKLKAQLRHDAEPRYTYGIDNLQGRGRWGGEDVAEVEDEKGVSYVITEEPNWSISTIERQDIVDWLQTRGFLASFFFPKATDAPDYLEPENPRYAPKLAAAVRAWQSVADVAGKTPKQALMKWLREHAAEFAMTDDEGKPNETAIEEAAKMANWQPGGGAPKTPGE